MHIDDYFIDDDDPGFVGLEYGDVSSDGSNHGYILEQGAVSEFNVTGDRIKITGTPMADTDGSLYSSIYGGVIGYSFTDLSYDYFIGYKDEENSNTITSEFQDDYSIGLFGLFEGTYSANNGISIQNTLDNYVIGELNRRCYPLNSVSLEVINSSLCDMSKLKIGHIVEVELKPFFNFKDNLRVIEITHNTENETYNLTVGETIFRPAKPTVKYYSK